MDVNYIFSLSEDFFTRWGYLLVFVSTFIETTPLGFLIPGSTIVAIAGYYSYSTPLNTGVIIFFSSLGMLTTFSLSYYFGYVTGYSLIKLYKQEKNSQKAKKILDKNGPIVITTALISNITRFWIAYLCGIQKYKFRKFLFYAFIASVSWNSLLTMLGYFAGSGRFVIEKGLAGIGIFSYILLLIIPYVIYRILKKNSLE